MRLCILKSFVVIQLQSYCAPNYKAIALLTTKLLRTLTTLNGLLLFSEL
jgi:hypothetical protein